jgi:hypothetical protein
MVLAIFNPSSPLGGTAFAQDVPAEVGEEPSPKKATTEELVAELTDNPELLTQLSYVSSLRVDKLFSPKSTFTFKDGGFVPSEETWKNWVKKTLKDQADEEVAGNYQQFLKYAPALAQLGILKGCQPTEATAEVPMKELTKEFLTSGASQAHQYCNGRRLGTMFSAKANVLVGPGASLRPSFDAWRRWATGQGVPKKVKPTKPDEELYGEFIRFLPVLTQFGNIKQ